jgi:hypothetical protein
MIHAATRMTPFGAKYHYHLVMQFKAHMQLSSRKSGIQADTFAADLEKIHETLCKNLHEAKSRQTIYPASKEVLFAVADKVWLSTHHFWTPRLWQRIDYKWT